MSSTRSFRLDSPRPIDGLLSLPDGSGPWPTIVVCHGFKGFMEWGFFPALAELLVERRFAVVRFNFSGSGMAPGEDIVTDLDAFRRNTFTREVEDLVTVLEAVAGDLAPESIDADRIGLLGHSRGGGIALLASARERLPVIPRALVTWAAIATFDRLSTAEVDQWRRNGTYLILNSRTGQELPLGLELLEDIETNGAALDIEAAAASRSCPWLIVHGVGDETVPVEEGRALADSAASTSRLVEVPEGDHTFGATHPFRGPTPALVRAFNETQGWFVRHLRGGSALE